MQSLKPLPWPIRPGSSSAVTRPPRATSNKVLRSENARSRTFFVALAKKVGRPEKQLNQCRIVLEKPWLQTRKNGRFRPLKKPPFSAIFWKGNSEDGKTEASFSDWYRKTLGPPIQSQRRAGRVLVRASKARVTEFPRVASRASALPVFPLRYWRDRACRGRHARFHDNRRRQIFLYVVERTRGR